MCVNPCLNMSSTEVTYALGKLRVAFTRLKEAARREFLVEGEIMLDMLEDRNKSSHMIEFTPLWKWLLESIYIESRCKAKL